MTKRKMVSVEMELLREQIKKLVYAQQSVNLTLQDIKSSYAATHLELIRQLKDTQATLDYVKSYVGIDAFFDECHRQEYNAS